MGRRSFERQERKQTVDHRALRVRQVAVAARGAPEITKPLAGFEWPAARVSIGNHHGVDGSRGGARNAIDLNAAILDQSVEHTPRERAMGAASLQREVDLLAHGLAYSHSRHSGSAFLAF